MSREPVFVGLLLAGAAALGVAANHHPARTPYQTCIAAANTPGDAGFATEVCEPLMPGWVEPEAPR